MKKIVACFCCLMFVGNPIGMNSISAQSGTSFSVNQSEMIHINKNDLVYIINSKKGIRKAFADFRILHETDEELSCEDALRIMKEKSIYNLYNLVNSKESYVVRFNRSSEDKCTKKEYIECSKDVLYEIDGVKNEIRSHKTGEVLQDLSVEPMFHIADGDLCYIVVKEVNTENFLMLDHGSPIASRIGDINSDGVVDLVDLSKLSLAIIGDNTLTEKQIKNADINGDGKVDLSDLARFRQYLSHAVTSLR
ncbi:MAG: hypothetical protein E7505_09700 [Ruminococcus sp.]|nr:hypothetical protein [Ruminococcus sp.]